MLLRVVVGSVYFNGLANKGFIIAPDGFSGWTSSTATKRNKVARVAAHGSFPVRGYRDERLVTISGTCLADSEMQLAFFGDNLTGLLADGDLGRITVTHSGNTRFADCLLEGLPEFEMFAAGQAAKFKIQFTLPDPWKYGSTKTFASGSPAFHYGNFPATPVHTVTGTMPSGYSIYGPSGKIFTVTAAITAGQTHTIDMATGYLKVNGSVVFGAVSRGDLWTVPGGTPVTHTLVPVSGSGSLSTAVTDTFI
jgi:hypothetical protein